MSEVSTFADRDAASVDAFLQSQPGALFYASSRYRALLVELLGCRERSLVARDGERVCGFLPLLEQDGPDGRVVNSLPYYGSNGGPFSGSAEVAHRLAASYSEMTVGSAATTLVPTPTADQVIDSYPATHSDLRIAQLTPIAGVERGSLPPGVDPSARRNVAKAQRGGIRVARDPSELAALARIHRENILALGGLPKEERFFGLVRDRLEPEQDYDLYVARLDGSVVAALLVFSFNGVVEYFTPAIRHDARPLQPLAAILAEAIPEAAARGCRLWNWGGTWEAQHTLRRFKQKWGAVESSYRYRVQVNEPALLQRSAAELLRGYPGFYVVPFTALSRKESSSDVVL